MTPEQKARQQIDRQLIQAGWLVQDYREMNISAGLGVAVREFPLTTGDADYMLYADGKAIGVVEAKPKGHTLTGVETQSGKYLEGLPAGLPNYRLPLPFAYESTGEVTQFTNTLEPDARSRRVFTFHRPEELIRLVKLDKQVRTHLREMPPLVSGHLWRVQIESINNLERSLAANRPRALIQMATGSGKTFTAVNSCYRLIKYAGARRILFLVDRNNLGEQTLNEFQQFVSPLNGYKFTEEYTVQHLKKNTIAPAAKVCITTIQRLYSMLKGEEEFLEENEEGSLFETETSLFKEPLPVVYNPKIPIETFDFIVVDECHRSIYNVWRQVLEYFDSFLTGLTATPSAQTIGFFNSNLVQDYSHARAVADGVNVGYDVYRIETKITRDGAKLVREPGIFVPHRDRRTKGTMYRELDDDLTYAGSQLDRDVVAESQIRLVIRTFKERLPEIFPGRTEVPKTLVFAKTDLHAEDIVRIIREEFGKGNDFCQKITSKSTGKTPKELLSEFRNSYFPRIAVTVDMIATGTDVKPLECLIFMRNIRSLGYFEQMKGRGCRVVDPDVLQSVTPDARHKTCFVIVDAVGVFLLAAYDYVARHQGKTLDKDQKKHLRTKFVKGWELVPNTARLCIMNLYLHGIDADPCPIKSGVDSLASDPGERFSVVLTNPPFGKKSSISIVNEAGDLEKDDTAYERQDFWTTTKNKQLNFVQHIKTLLKVNGRCAVVVPDNVLFEGGAGETVRRNLMKQCDVHTLLRLPTGIFYAGGVKANVLFLDAKPAQEKPWTKTLWVYDLRTNMHFTQKTNPLARADLDEFVECYRPGKRHLRKPTWGETTPEGRWRSFDYDDLMKRDKVNLDIFWLRDKSLEDSYDLPTPDVLAQEIADDLQTALEQFTAIAEKVKG